MYNRGRHQQRCMMSREQQSQTRSELRSLASRYLLKIPTTPIIVASGPRDEGGTHWARGAGGRPVRDAEARREGHCRWRSIDALSTSSEWRGTRARV